MKKLPSLIIALLLISIGLTMGNCKKKTKTTDPEPIVIDTTSYFFEADNPKIHFSGRINYNDPKKPVYSAPGVYVKVKFKGTSFAVLFNDQFLWGKKNYYDVIIDDTHTFKITPIAGQTTYTVSKTLANKEHTAIFVKRTESSIGNCQFIGVRVQQLLSPPTKPARKLQFIGNSISCGSGIEAANNSSQCSEDGWGQPYHNAYLAFGPVMARALNAEYHLTAVSGIGLYRNYSTVYDARPMPQVYNLTYLESNAPTLSWNTANFQPDAIVIELGTNDFSPGDVNHDPKIDSATYVGAYINFITTLRGYYPDAHIFCLSSPMLSDGWPSTNDKSATNLKNALTGMVNYLNANGEPKVHKFFVTKTAGTGCGTHPGIAEHANMANEVGAYVSSVMGW